MRLSEHTESAHLSSAELSSLTGSPWVFCRRLFLAPLLEIV